MDLRINDKILYQDMHGNWIFATVENIMEILGDIYFTLGNCDLCEINATVYISKHKIKKIVILEE